MICRDCANKNHEACKEAEKTKLYKDCPCLHRVPKKDEKTDAPAAN